MPSIRIGYSSEFVLRNELVGIGSTATSSRLDVAGQIRSENTAGSGGVSTFREYQGFSQVEAEVSNNILIDSSSGPYSSLTGEIKITGETTVSSGSTVEVGKTKTLTVTDRFAVPLGDTNTRDNAPEAGTTRFNQDFGTLEFFDGNNWKTVNSYARGGAAGRALVAGGNDPGFVSMIQSYNITTLGDTINFGDRTVSGGGVAGFSNGTRAVFGGGTNPTFLNVIDYATIASGGTGADFGDFLSGTLIAYRAAASSSTRGIFSNGWVNGSSNTNAIEYVQISTTGNGVDFGDTSTDSGTGRRSCMALSSPTRYVVAGGYSSTYLNEMDYITISSLGNSLSFGDLTLNAFGAEGVSNTIVGAFGGGRGTPGAFSTTIDYLQISTTGSTSQFGDLIEITTQSAGSCTNTRGVFTGGYNPGVVEIMSYISLDSKGDSIDFGNLSLPVHKAAGTSDSHGGLGGF
tara:strand:+ start:24 stop:1400 length:1377 start_codon:yes stop_codon:yes gene_type:complete